MKIMTSLFGYRRPDGKIGIRNYLLVIPASVCAAETARRIADAVEGAVALPNQHGCTQIGEDFNITERTLIGFGKNPNVYGVLVIGLGCENISSSHLTEEIAKSGKPVEYLIIQELGGTVKTQAKGVEILKNMAKSAALQKREAFDISELIVALECGSSDATSGLCANPSLGVASDLVVSYGGTVILSETTEFIGAEHILAKRAKRPVIGQQILDMVKACEAKSLTMGVDLRGSQPTPGNILGGLTTIEEKSLGCIHKAGTSDICGVLSYGQPVEGKGLYVMDSPGQDIESITGMVAAGAQIVVFTTGRGSPTGSPIVPVIKVTGNPKTAISMGDHIDINCGTVIEGTETIDQCGNRIFHEIFEVSNGKLTCAETLGHREFGIYKVMSAF